MPYLVNLMKKMTKRFRILHLRQTLSVICKMLFIWTGSCACGHDLYPILHTRSQFLPTAGRTAGISLFFPPQLCSWQNFPAFEKCWACPDLKLDYDFVQRWLVRAKEHLRTYLQEQQGRGAGKRKSQVNSFRKMMSSSDVSRYLRVFILCSIITTFASYMLHVR